LRSREIAAWRMALSEGHRLEAIPGRTSGHVLASETASGPRGRLTLGTFTGQDLVHDLPSALRAFRVTRPRVDLRLVSSQRGSTGMPRT
jgi:DNA-binding transcriptional LysR family regulator